MKKEEKKIKFPQYINTNEKSVSINGFMQKNDKPEDYLEGKGYIRSDDSIWIFCEKAPRKETVNSMPFFWFEDGVKKFSNPSALTKNIYNISSMQDYSVVSVIDNTVLGEKLYNEEEILDINASSNFYVPIINKDDDFLKKVVKTIIIEKGINVRRLKSKTELPYILPNMITALNNKTKMSTTYFACWMELLGCSFDIVIRDNGEDTVNPLNNPHLYDNDKDTMSVVINGKEIEIDLSQYYKTSETEDEIS